MKWVSAVKQKKSEKQTHWNFRHSIVCFVFEWLVSAIKARRTKLGLSFQNMSNVTYFCEATEKKMKFVKRTKIGVNAISTWYNSNRIGTPPFPISIDNWNLEEIRFLYGVLGAIFSSNFFRG